MTDNNIALVKHNDRYVATLWSRFQLNNFQSTDQRYPELALDIPRQQIKNTGIRHRRRSSKNFLNIIAAERQGDCATRAREIDIFGIGEKIRE